MFVMLGISMLFFVVAGMQYWASNYFLEIIGASYQKVTFWYSLAAITGPLCGAMLSSPVVNYFGGLKSPNTPLLCTMLSFICSCVALPLPLQDTWYVVMGHMWMILFIGGMLMPILTGCMLSLVERRLKTKANSIGNLFYNMLGYLPAPYLYG